MLLDLKHVVHQIEKAENQQEVPKDPEIAVVNKVEDYQQPSSSADETRIQKNQASPAVEKPQGDPSITGDVAPKLPKKPSGRSVNKKPTKATYEEVSADREKKMKENLSKVKAKQPKRKMKIDLFKAFPDSDEELEREKDAKEAFDNMLNDVLIDK